MGQLIIKQLTYKTSYAPHFFQIFHKNILFLLMLALIAVIVLNYYALLLYLSFLQFYFDVGCLTAALSISLLETLFLHFLITFFLPFVSNLHQHTVPILISVFPSSIFLLFSSSKPLL